MRGVLRFLFQQRCEIELQPGLRPDLIDLAQNAGNVSGLERGRDVRSLFRGQQVDSYGRYQIVVEGKGKRVSVRRETSCGADGDHNGETPGVRRGRTHVRAEAWRGTYETESICLRKVRHVPEGVEVSRRARCRLHDRADSVETTDKNRVTQNADAV